MRLIRLITVLHVASAVVLAQYVIQTVAGGGPNNVPAVQASLSYPWGVATDSSGNVFLSAGGRIFRVNASGTLTVFAGSGLNGFAGDGGAATGASFSGPKGLAVDNQGNLYVADEANNRIRKVSATTGIVTTVAGDGTGMFRGDGGPAINAGLFLPTSIAVDGSGNIYIADVQNVCVRKVTVATGIISTVAGNGAPGFSGDGGPATNAGFASLQ
ncbi:MAG: hypothetical protein HY248_05925, partial [Fimbriimonas ginsengisoli]|nr:hypothetical protein [Fimbriimonas ginsengisoli]